LHHHDYLQSIIQKMGTGGTVFLDAELITAVINVPHSADTNLPICLETTGHSNAVTFLNGCYAYYVHFPDVAWSNL
jgi:hypothetical protein